MRGALAGIVWIVVTGAACRDAAEQAPPAPPRRALAEYLGSVAGIDEASRTLEVSTWVLDRATWDRTVVASYRGLHADYLRAFEAAAPDLVARLATRGAIATRPHYAGDARLTLGQARARWALPVQYPSEVADLDGVPINAVFVRDGDHWRAIVGVDGVLRARAAAIDPACAAHLDLVRSKACSDVGWVIADAALQADTKRFAHACSLAATLCAP
jgi:hypothetical protein